MDGRTFLKVLFQDKRSTSVMVPLGYLDDQGLACGVFAQFVTTIIGREKSEFCPQEPGFSPPCFMDSAPTQAPMDCLDDGHSALSCSPVGWGSCPILLSLGGLFESMNWGAGTTK